ncbi:MAG: ATP synthase F1 subunit delta [Planctomycetota bacterium]
MSVNLARRYAAGLFEAVNPSSSGSTGVLLDTVLEQLETLASLAVNPTSETPEEQRELYDLMVRPGVTYETRNAALTAILQSFGFLTDIIAFAGYALKKKRFTLLPSVYTEFLVLYHHSRNEVRAHVSSARGLDSASAARIKSTLSAFTGSSILMNTSVDSTLIAGVKVRIGNLVLDGSYRARLNGIRSAIERAALDKREVRR